MFFLCRLKGRAACPPVRDARRGAIAQIVQGRRDSPPAELNCSYIEIPQTYGKELAQFDRKARNFTNACLIWKRCSTCVLLSRVPALRITMNHGLTYVRTRFRSPIASKMPAEGCPRIDPYYFSRTKIKTREIDTCRCTEQGQRSKIFFSVWSSQRTFREGGGRWK